jgi:DNA-binding response OmpR family regulator
LTTTAVTKTSIFFVDDEALLLTAFTRELRAEHFTITAVGDGSEAVAALRAERFDVVITDLMMPGVDGFGVLKAAKELAPQTSVIILTGYGDMRAAIDALRLRADDFTLKPCELEELHFRIGRCLQKRCLLQQLAEQNQQLPEAIACRQQIEAQLLKSETRFRLALEASSNGVWDRNLVSAEVYFGENWHRTLGYEDPREIRNKLFFENLLHPEGRVRVLTQREAHAQGLTPR